MVELWKGLLAATVFLIVLGVLYIQVGGPDSPVTFVVLFGMAVFTTIILYFAMRLGYVLGGKVSE